MQTIIKDYFNSLSDIISSQAKLASANQHNPDTGENRETILRDFFNKHLPDRLRTIIGGNILGLGGHYSKQIDIIVKNDLFPKFEQNNKTFILMDSVAAAVTVKSNLNTSTLEDCLLNIASIPQLDKKTFSLQNSSIKREGIEDDFMKKHPTLAVFAYDGVASNTIANSIDDFYRKNSSIPLNRMPHFIIVNGKYFFHRPLTDSLVSNGGSVHRTVSDGFFRARTCSLP